MLLALHKAKMKKPACPPFVLSADARPLRSNLPLCVTRDHQLWWSCVLFPLPLTVDVEAHSCFPSLYITSPSVVLKRLDPEKVMNNFQPLK